MTTRLTSCELAARYGVTITTINTWRRKGWISGYRTPGRIGYIYAPDEADEALRRRGFMVESAPDG